MPSGVRQPTTNSAKPNVGLAVRPCCRKLKSASPFSLLIAAVIFSKINYANVIIISMFGDQHPIGLFCKQLLNLQYLTLNLGVKGDPVSVIQPMTLKKPKQKQTERFAQDHTVFYNDGRMRTRDGGQISCSLTACHFLLELMLVWLFTGSLEVGCDYGIDRG